MSTMAPSRGSSFEGRMFFVYDCEACKKEEDPPESAIIYFYPHGATIEDQVSICGQIVGMSKFLTDFHHASPVLFKLKTEKIVISIIGDYILALGGDLGEPDSLLIRQLETLYQLFAFYHGSIDIVRKMCRSQASFLTQLCIIWDCYLPFVRHYGDTLPAVFDPLQFLETPKNSSGCFLKASHILQAFQRRPHILGGCILYSNSVLCTHLDPSVTRRLLLLKPNQSHHPAKPVTTDIKLPFGVRILNSYVTLLEFQGLLESMSQSPYRQQTAQVAKKFSNVSTCLTPVSSTSERTSESPSSMDGLLNERALETESSQAVAEPINELEGKKPDNLRPECGESSPGYRRRAESSGGKVRTQRGRARRTQSLPTDGKREKREDQRRGLRAQKTLDSTVIETGSGKQPDGIEIELHKEMCSSSSPLHQDTSEESEIEHAEIPLTNSSKHEKPVENAYIPDLDAIRSGSNSEKFASIGAVTSITNSRWSLGNCESNEIDGTNGKYLQRNSYCRGNVISLSSGSHVKDGLSREFFNCEDNGEESNHQSSGQDVEDLQCTEPGVSGDGIGTICTCSDNGPVNKETACSLDVSDDNQSVDEAMLVMDGIDTNGLLVTQHERSFPVENMQLFTTENNAGIMEEGVNNSIGSEGMILSSEEMLKDGRDLQNPSASCLSPDVGRQEDLPEDKSSDLDPCAGDDEGNYLLGLDVFTNTVQESKVSEGLTYKEGCDTVERENLLTAADESGPEFTERNRTKEPLVTILDKDGCDMDDESLQPATGADRNSDKVDSMLPDYDMTHSSTVLISEKSETSENLECIGQKTSENFEQGAAEKSHCSEQETFEYSELVTSDKSERSKQEQDSKCYQHEGYERPNCYEHKFSNNSECSTADASRHHGQNTERKYHSTEETCDSCTVDDMGSPGKSPSGTCITGSKIQASAFGTDEAEKSQTHMMTREESVYEDCPGEFEDERPQLGASKISVPFEDLRVSTGSPSVYHDTVEDMVPDVGHRDYLHEITTEIYKDFSCFDEADNLRYATKYSEKNLNVYQEKSVDKCLFKDITHKDSNLGRVVALLDDQGGASHGTEEGRLGVPSSSSAESSVASTNRAEKGEFVDAQSEHSNQDFSGVNEGDCSLGGKGEGALAAAEGQSSKNVTDAGKSHKPHDDIGNDYDDDQFGEEDPGEEYSNHRVDGMVHINLYVQAHSEIVLILLAEPALHKDPDTIKALWKATVNELGDLEFRIQQAMTSSSKKPIAEEYSFLVYDGFSKTMKGNQREPVSVIDHMFCDTAKTVHEHFNNSPSLRSITLRGQTSAVHGQRSLDQEVFYQKKGSLRAAQGVPNIRDPVYSLESRAGKVLHREHGVNVF
ncbi:uncharacterized protein LOC5516524 [Nematostella vectensis]|uniref:uncharacterized protein LOC5516524 n=1 Tax=Nematostella vectensis TaxID=45351 RepID=UPI0020776002|nr:uncharacterized protein LOC5516524 [Nematostella vectensis]